MQIQNYINERVENQLNYFDFKSTLNKNYYQLFKIMQLAAAALLPFFSIFLVEYLWMKYIVAFLGTMVTILEGVLATGKYHEKWVTYRSTAELIRQEKFMYLMKAGNYDQPNANAQFVTKIELLLGKETAGWQQMIIKDNSRNNDSNSSSDKAPIPSGAGNMGQVEAGKNDEDLQSAPLDPLTGVNNDTEEVREKI